MPENVISTYHDSPELWKSLLRKGLEDDHWQLDWTTLGTLKSARKKISAVVIAKAAGIWAGAGAGAALSVLAHEMGGSLEIKSVAENGAPVRPKTTVMKWTGTPREVLALERPFLNLASYASGIATSTHALVAQVRKACPARTPRIVPTRKILPGYRDLSILAVQIGGGFSHRVDLSGGVLIKENHIAAAGGISKAVVGARAVAPHGLKIEVEVRDLNELADAISADADGVLLDNFTPAKVRQALKLVGASSRKIFVEVSGGLDETNIASFAIPGVDILSVGSLTHSVKGLDLSLLVEGL